jgi:hypothetical protein
MVTFRRGTGSLEVEVASIQTYLEGTVEPVLNDHTDQISDLKTFKDKTQGQFTVIIVLNSIILTLVAALIVALFSWGLSHITLKVQNDLLGISQWQNAILPSPESHPEVTHAK